MIHITWYFLFLKKRIKESNNTEENLTVIYEADRNGKQASTKKHETKQTWTRRYRHRKSGMPDRKRGRRHVRSVSYYTDLCEYPRKVKKQTKIASSKQNKRAKRFFHRYDSEKSFLKTYDRPSCGPIQVLQWLHTQKIKFEDLMKKRRTAKTVLRYAIDGIKADGENIHKTSEAEEMCKALMIHLNSDLTKTSDIGECCARLFTQDTFLFKRVNKVLHEKELAKHNHLAPYCALLSAYLQKQCFNDGKYRISKSRLIYKAVSRAHLYRGANLTKEMFEQYRKNIGQRISWRAFSSTTKRQEVAEMFGNTLFTIDAAVLTAVSADYLADIQHISKFPDEEEVLLTAGINLVIGVVNKRKDGKYNILLYVSENYRNKISRQHASVPISSSSASRSGKKTYSTARFCI